MKPGGGLWSIHNDAERKEAEVMDGAAVLFRMKHMERWVGARRKHGGDKRSEETDAGNCPGLQQYLFIFIFLKGEEEGSEEREENSFSPPFTCQRPVLKKQKPGNGTASSSVKVPGPSATSQAALIGSWMVKEFQCGVGAQEQGLAAVPQSPLQKISQC